jgi:hypothetical protein
MSLGIIRGKASIFRMLRKERKKERKKEEGGLSFTFQP